MRPVTLFIALSLDGFIADGQGGVDWLQGQDPNADLPDSYGPFIQTVDTVVMGAATYRQIVTELSPGEWPYQGLEAYVITHSPQPGRPGITFTGLDACTLVKQLKARSGKGIWICGGAAIARPLIEHDLIDRYHLSVIPTLLGGGVRLFGPLNKPLPLRLVHTQSGNGITDLVYQRR